MATETSALPPSRPQSLFVMSLVFFTIAFSVRYFSIPLSLWYDELFTVLNYVVVPWKVTLTGDYAPNHHLLSSVLIKLVNDLGTSLGLFSPITALLVDNYTIHYVQNLDTLRFRLPSLVAGSFVPLALAWPLLKSQAATRFQQLLPFALIAILAVFLPWLVAFSVEARGYSLLLLFSILATNQLDFLAAKRGRILYILWMVAALLTIPIAAAVLFAHALLMATRGWNTLKHWLLPAIVATLVAAGGYFPLLASMKNAAATMVGHHTTILEFAASLARSLSYGWNARNTSPALTLTIAILLLIWLSAGTLAAWKHLPALRSAISTFLIASIATLLGALLYPAARENRFVLWLAPSLILSTAGLLLCLIPLKPSSPTHTENERKRIPKKHALRFSLATLLLLAILSVADILIANTPAQPWAEAFIQLVPLVGEGSLAIIHTGATESSSLYYAILSKIRAIPVYTPSLLDTIEKEAFTPQWLAIGYTNRFQRDNPALYLHIEKNYDKITTLPGRIDDMTLWKRRQN